MIHVFLIYTANPYYTFYYTFRVIFDRIGHDGLAKDLFLYSSGLFPLLEYGSMTVRPVLLDLYEQYYIPLGLALLPGLSGVLAALLPGLEEGSEYSDRLASNYHCMIPYMGGIFSRYKLS